MITRENRKTYYRLGIIWLAIVLLGSFWLSVRSTSNPVTLTVLPQAPRQGEPVFATFQLNNPSSEPLVTSYQFYANGELLREGKVTLGPRSNETYKYVYDNALPQGEQLNFLVTTQSAKGNFEQLVSTPPYPPQVLTSFISFASFSTSVMTSMSSMAYYTGTFSSLGVNIGIIMAVVLIFLLIFLELAGTHIQDKSAAIGRLRIRFGTLTWVLLIVFVAMVYTRVALILAT